MRGWERVTTSDVARLGKKRPAEALKHQHKFHAEPCIVTPDGTLYTASEIDLVELAFPPPLKGPLLERAARCGINGRWFASKKEGKRYLELRELERAGVISELRTQVEFDLTVVSHVDGRVHHVGRMTIDFEYHRDGTRVLEDTKGGDRRKAAKTEAYLLRKKICQAQYGIEILET